MNDIEILENMRDNIYGEMQFEDDYQVSELEKKEFHALNSVITALKERQADKDRIKELQKQANELVDDYGDQLSEKNNYIFQLENEREALHKLIDEEMG